MFGTRESTWSATCWTTLVLENAKNIVSALIHGGVKKEKGGGFFAFPFCLFTLKDFLVVKHQSEAAAGSNVCLLFRWSCRWMFLDISQCTENSENDSRLNEKQSCVSKQPQWKVFIWKETYCFWKARRKITYSNTRLPRTTETHSKP